MMIEIKTTHDNIKIKTALWGFSVGRSAIRPSGTLPSDIFSKFANIVENFKGTTGEAVQSIVDNIDTLWPEWNLNKIIAVGDIVSFDYKKQVITATVIVVNKNNVNVDCSLGKNISIPKGLLK